jgi:transcriptional regulator with XRE-family HTH domain
MPEDLKHSDIFTIRLRNARENIREWSQSQLAERASMPPSSIAHFETGKRKPSFDTLRRLANALDVTTDYLLGRVDDPALAEAGDPLYRDMGKLTADDRDTARLFIKALADRESKNKKNR